MIDLEHPIVTLTEEELLLIRSNENILNLIKKLAQSLEIKTLLVETPELKGTDFYINLDCS